VKIILSRKGFDSSTGGVPSPLFPDGSLVSLPIPEKEGTRRYHELHTGPHALGDMVYDLTGGRIGPDSGVHLDPDLNAAILGTRPPGWRPVFGQDSAAEGHLRRHAIGPGDLFLFYGWFRAVEYVGGHYRYVPGAPDLHVLFGWLQVGTRIPVTDRAAIPPWAAEHPHCKHRPYSRLDAIYLAAERLTLPAVPIDQPGGGIFARLTPARQLTAPDSRLRSHWRVPPWLHPTPDRPALSYHARPDRWQAHPDHARLHTVGRGQEFVFDTAAYPEAPAWIAGLFSA
jgi:hypothetical protein